MKPIPIRSNKVLCVEDLPGQGTHIDLVGRCHPSAPARIAAADGPAMAVSCTTCGCSIVVLGTERPLPGAFVSVCCAGAGSRVRFARKGAYAEILCRACGRMLDRVRLRHREPAAAPVRPTILAIVHRGAPLRHGRLSDIVRTLGEDERHVTDDLNAAVLDRATWIAGGRSGPPPTWADRTGVLALAYPRLGDQLDERAAEFLAMGFIELGDGAEEAEGAGLERTAGGYRRLIGLIEARAAQEQRT